MRHVRCFGKTIDPSEYRHGYGFRGWWINVINRIRIFLERHIVLQILRFESAKAGWDPDEVVKEAKRDPNIRPWLMLEQPSRTEIPKPLQRTPSRGYSSHEEKTHARYEEGRKAVHRPKPLEDGAMVVTLSVAQRNQSRTARYVPGRQHLVYDSNYFEPVDSAND